MRLSIQEIAVAIGAAVPQAACEIDHISTDSRDLSGSCLFVALEGERTDGHRYIAQALNQGARFAVAHKQPEGLTLQQQSQVLLVPDTMQVLLQIAALYRRKFSLLTVGITGSVGKTTTKEFVAGVLSKKYRTLKNQGNRNNEIGLPNTIFELDSSYEAAVLEMGMDRKGDISKLTAVVRPDVGIITNIGVAHIEYLKTRQGILNAKLEITEGMQDGAPLILCADNDLLSSVELPRLRVVRYGIDAENCAVQAKNLRAGKQGTAFEVQYPGGSCTVELPTVGRHTVYDALAAFAAGLELGVPVQDIADALAEYQPTGMRQRMRRWKELLLVEDCYNANPDSMHAALHALQELSCKGRKICVFADMLELGALQEQAHLEIGRAAAQTAQQLYCYGRWAQLYAQGAEQGGMKPEQIHCFTNAEQLAQTLRQQAQAGDILWFKGSHSMHLEHVLEQAFPEQDV